MEKYAVIQLGGKQIRVTEGMKFDIERQKDLKNLAVLMYSDGKAVSIGTPLLKDVKVSASIIDNKNAKKIRVARFKSKSRYRKVKGHKQPISVIEIKSITKGAAKKAEPKVEKKPVVKKAKKVEAK